MPSTVGFFSTGIQHCSGFFFFLCVSFVFAFNSMRWKTSKQITHLFERENEGVKGWKRLECELVHLLVHPRILAMAWAALKPIASSPAGLLRLKQEPRYREPSLLSPATAWSGSSRQSSIQTAWHVWTVQWNVSPPKTAGGNGYVMRNWRFIYHI